MLAENTLTITIDCFGVNTTFAKSGDDLHIVLLGFCAAPPNNKELVAPPYVVTTRDEHVESESFLDVLGTGISTTDDESTCNYVGFANSRGALTFTIDKTKAFATIHTSKNTVASLLYKSNEEKKPLGTGRKWFWGQRFRRKLSS